MDTFFWNVAGAFGVVCSINFVLPIFLEKLKMKFRNSFSPYIDRRMIRIFLLGMMSGFPWVLIGSALTLWLKEDGLSRTTVGFAGLIFGVYAFNFLWAPLIDRLSL